MTNKKGEKSVRVYQGWEGWSHESWRSLKKREHHLLAHLDYSRKRFSRGRVWSSGPESAAVAGSQALLVKE